jgi:hypothetical protein
MNGIFHSGSLIIPSTYFLPPGHLLSQLALLAALAPLPFAFPPRHLPPPTRFDNYGKIQRKGTRMRRDLTPQPDRVQLPFSSLATARPRACFDCTSLQGISKNCRGRQIDGDRERFPKRICISARVPISVGDAVWDPFYQPETLTREDYLKELAIFDARIFRQGNISECIRKRLTFALPVK